LTITHILCPVDFSEFSQRALAHAAALASWYEAKLTVLHVEPPAETGRGAASDRSSSGATREEILGRLQQAVDRAGRPDVDVHLAVEQGETARRILEQADAIGADFLVIGTHGRSGIDNVLLGSIAAKVVWGASCPVLTVPRLATAESASAVVFKRILCAIDFSPSSLRALDFALSLGQEANGKATLLHVIEAFGDDEEPSIQTHFNVPQYRGDLERTVRERLRTLVPAEARVWCDVDEVVLGSKAYKGILRVAAALQADLIVMGAQGHAGFDLMLFGSTTEHVLRRAACPVLTVRAAG
jgi:nucleotide-binding universal stress UspA family protein